MTTHELSNIWSIDGRYEKRGDPYEGGFAYVYRCYDYSLDRFIALKRLKPQRLMQGHWVANFRQESKKMAQVQHPNVVQVYDVGIDQDVNGDEIDYFIMEWVDGKSLQEWRVRQPIMPDKPTLLKIALDICNGLEAIHNKGIVHGDLTTRNVLITTQNGQYTAKLTDFGLSWHIADGTPKVVAGTRTYMAPEQIAGNSWDTRADLYALGAVLFFLVSGEHHLQSVQQTQLDLTFDELKRSVLEEPSRKLNGSDTFRTQMNQLIARLLKKEPAERIQTVAEVRQQLEDIQLNQSNVGSVIEPSITATELVHTDEQVPHIIVGFDTSNGAANAFRETVKAQFESSEGAQDHWAWNDPDEIIEKVFGYETEYDFYARNLGTGNNTGEHLVYLVLATDTNNSNNSELQAKLEKTLILKCVHRPNRDRLLVISVYLKGLQEGTRRTGSLPICISFVDRHRVKNRRYDIPDNLINEIKKLTQDTDPEVTKRLEHWRAYLKVWQRLVEEKTYEVEYISWRPVRSKKSTKSAEIWLVLTDRVSSEWQKIKNSRNEQVDICDFDDMVRAQQESQVDEDADPPYSKLGLIKECRDHDGFEVLIELDDKSLEAYQDADGNLNIPEHGFLAYRAIGDIAQVHKQQRAFDDLEQGKSANPRLGRFVFDAEQALYPDEEENTLRLEQFLIPHLNENQRKAVQGALVAPDLYLIWGPPGTGKTTVIAELCYQFTRRGERVLVSSQANLAVDNALSKLVHHPSITALRIGNRNRIEEEGLPFIDSQVADRWFVNTAQDGSQQLSELPQCVDMFAGFVEADYLRLQEYQRLVEEETIKLPDLKQAHEKATTHLNELERAIESTDQQLTDIQTAFDLLRTVEQNLENEMVPANESWRHWRNVIKLAGTTLYTEFLRNLVDACSVVSETQPYMDLVATLLNSNERTLLARVYEGTDRAEIIYEHRPTAILTFGQQVGAHFDQHMEANQVQQFQIIEFAGRVTHTASFVTRIHLIDEIVEVRRVVQILHQLNPLVHELGNKYRVYFGNDKQVADKQQKQAQLNARCVSIEAELETLQFKLFLSPQIKHFQTEIHQHLQELQVTVSQGTSTQQHIVRLKQQLQTSDHKLKDMQAEVDERVEDLKQCRQILATLDSWMPHLSGLLNGYEVDKGVSTRPLRDYVNQILLENSASLVITAENVYEQTLQILSDTIRQSQKLIPSEQLDKFSPEQAQEIRHKLRGLIQPDYETPDIWIPASVLTFKKDLQKIVEAHLSQVRTVKGKVRFARDWTTVASEVDSLDKFHKFIRAQLQLREQIKLGKHQFDQVDPDKLVIVLDELTSVLQEELQQLERDMQRANHEITQIQNQIDAIENGKRQNQRGIVVVYDRIADCFTEMQEKLGDNTLNSIIQTLRSVRTRRDTSSVIQQIEDFQQRISDQLNQLTTQIASKQSEHATVKQEIAALDSELQRLTYSAHAMRTELGRLYSEIDIIYAQIGEIALTQDVQQLYAVLDSLLQIISEQGALDLSAYVAAYTETLNRQESRVRRLQAELRELASGEALSLERLPELQAEWKAEYEAELSNLRSAASTILEQLQKVLRDTQSIPWPRLENLDSEAWHQVHLQMKAMNERESAVVQGLDPWYVLKSLREYIAELHAECFSERESLTVQHQQAHQAVQDSNRILRNYCQRLEDEASWWQRVYASIPTHFRGRLSTTDSIHSSTFIGQLLASLHDESVDWEQEKDRQERMLAPSQRLLEDWLARLDAADDRDVESVREVYVANANVIGVTCGQVNRISRNRDLRPFDVVIIDEVSKATPPELLMPMLKGKKIILVGDHKQLPPMLESDTLKDVAEKLEIPKGELTHLDRSLFEDLYDFAPKALRGMLTQQYRMRHPIMNAINQFYDDMLTGGHDRRHGIYLPHRGVDPDTSLVWLDMPHAPRYLEQSVGTSYKNPEEVEQISHLLTEMNQAWLQHFYDSGVRKEIGVITFYLPQYRALKERIAALDLAALDVRFGTVDRFQGMERQIVIVSLVRNNQQGEIGFAKSPERINVAFSRAQELLVIVGCKSLFTRRAKRTMGATDMYALVAEVIRKNGTIIGAERA